MGLSQVHPKYVARQETPPRRDSVLSFAAQVPSACFQASNMFYGQDSKSPFQTRSKLLASFLFRMYLACGVRVGDGYVGAIWCQKQDIAAGRRDLEGGQGVMTEQHGEGPPLPGAGTTLVTPSCFSFRAFHLPACCLICFSPFSLLVRHP